MGSDPGTTEAAGRGQMKKKAAKGGAQGGGEIGDPVLVKAAQAGDREAMAALLAKHESRMFATCVRMISDRERARDLTQDAMIKVIEGLGSFDGRASFTTWMTRVTMNLCLSHLRKEKLRRHASLDAQVGTKGETRPLWATMQDGSELPSEERIETRERVEHLERAMAEIDPEQRAILILRDVRGMDYRQIADVLGIAVGTVKSRLFRSRAALREAIEQNNK